MALFTGSRKYKLTGITPILGTQPANEEIRSAWVASKAPTEDLSAEESQLFGDVKAKGLTVFPQDPAGQTKYQIIMLDYMVRGFLKSAMQALKPQNSIASPKSKVDQFVFVLPRRIPILRDGKAITQPDRVFERPLRAETMQGPRVALAASEQIDDPWTVEFSIDLLENTSGKNNRPVTWEAIEDALDYGKFCGLGQFRNGSYGRFTWERVG